MTGEHVACATVFHPVRVAGAWRRRAREMIARGLVVMVLLLSRELATTRIAECAAAVERQHVEKRRGSATADRPSPSVARAPRSERGPFLWPVRGRVTSHFGRRGFRGWHSGTDIKAPRGTPIRAA